MVKLQLQDANDVGRHTLDAAALYWPRIRPSTREYVNAANHVLAVAASAALLVIAMPQPAWPMLASGLLLLLAWWRTRWFAAEQLTLNVDVDPDSNRLKLWHVIVALSPCVVAFLFTPYVEEFGFVLSALVVTVFAEVFTQHNIWYLTAHPSNTLETQEKWRNAFRSLWQKFPPVKPARDDLTSEEQREFDVASREFSSFRKRRSFAMAIFYTLVALVCSILMHSLRSSTDQPTSADEQISARVIAAIVIARVH